MPPDSVLPVRFEARDVISAQRMRFLKSSRVKLIAGLWAAVELFIILSLAFPNLLPWKFGFTPGLAVGMAIAFVVVLALFYWIAPILAFNGNPVWQTPFTLRITEHHLFLSMQGKERGNTVEWKRFKKMHENDRAYLLYLSSEENFLIIPKSVFADRSDEARFRRLLRTKSSIPDKEKIA